MEPWSRRCFIVLPRTDFHAFPATPRVSAGYLAVPYPGLPPTPARSAARSGWARLLARIYEVFPLRCPDCAGEMRILAFLTDPLTVAGMLRHLGLPTSAPPLTPARSLPPDEPAYDADPLLDLDQTPTFNQTDPDPIPDWPPITAHPASTPTAIPTSLRFDFDQTHGA